VPDLNESDLVLPRPERLHDAVDAIAWQSEDDLDAPLVKGVDENVCCRICHDSLLVRSNRTAMPSR
jgi:hypothetical protein